MENPAQVCGGTDMLNMAANLIHSVLPIVDKIVPDKDQAAKIKAELQTQGVTYMAAEMKAKASVLVSEMTGESWLQRNWRPLTMLIFVGLITAFWLGFTAPNITEAVVVQLLEIIKIGLGGYIVGRSGEKIMKEWKK